MSFVLIFGLSFAIMLAAMVGMAVGQLAGRAAIRGSCGGLNSGAGGCDLCNSGREPLAQHDAEAALPIACSSPEARRAR
jgi:hypothetical protein